MINRRKDGGRDSKKKGRGGGGGNGADDDDDDDDRGGEVVNKVKVGNRKGEDHSFQDSIELSFCRTEYTAKIFNLNPFVFFLQSSL